MEAPSSAEIPIEPALPVVDSDAVPAVEEPAPESGDLISTPELLAELRAKPPASEVQEEVWYAQPASTGLEGTGEAVAVGSEPEPAEPEQVEPAPPAAELWYPEPVIEEEPRRQRKFDLLSFLPRVRRRSPEASADRDPQEPEWAESEPVSKDKTPYSEPTVEEAQTPEPKLGLLSFFEATRSESLPDSQSGFESSELEESLPVEELDSFPPPAVEVSLPAGFYRDLARWNGLLTQEGPFTGVAIALGINELSSMAVRLGEQNSAELLASVEQLVQTLLLEDDFGCRLEEGEFLLLMPGQTGGSAQRRLRQVSQRLWDFQLRSLGSFSILFSWGGVAAEGESLVDVVSAAKTRMYQTRRTRKEALSEVGHARLRAGRN